MPANFKRVSVDVEYAAPAGKTITLFRDSLGAQNIMLIIPRAKARGYYQFDEFY